MSWQEWAGIIFILYCSLVIWVKFYLEPRRRKRLLLGLSQNTHDLYITTFGRPLLEIEELFMKEFLLKSSYLSSLLNENGNEHSLMLADFLDKTYGNLKITLLEEDRIDIMRIVLSFESIMIKKLIVKDDDNNDFKARDQEELTSCVDTLTS